MSWRQFQILLKGLSPYGAFASHYDSESKRLQIEERITDPVQMQQEADSLWGALHAIAPKG